jgi:hypothetical protein
MGRYYNGDIEGKFWFAVQSSNAADRFGSEGYSPDYINYSFDTSHIPIIKEELKSIEQEIPIKILDKFFSKNISYNNEEVIEFCENEGLDFPIDKGLRDKILQEWLREYADYDLGKKILKCVEENEYCDFEAEC